MDISIILNKPKYDGNIGFVARSMKNFGFEDLILIDVDEFSEETRSRASHAQELLENAKRVESVDEVFNKFDLRVATTGIRGESEDRFKRNPYLSPKELKTKLRTKKGSCGILFGREDYGLSNDLIKRCEIVLSIPSNSEYPVLNLSHAVSIILYKLNDLDKGEKNVASREELDAVYHRLNSLIDTIDYPEYKLEKTKLMVRRIFGRSILSSREAHTLAGLFRKTEKQVSEKKDR